MVKLFHLQKTKNLLLESIHLTYKQKGRPESDKVYNFPAEFSIDNHKSAWPDSRLSSIFTLYLF